MASEDDALRRRIAAESLAKKIRLESSVERRFNQLFREIGSDFKRVYSQSGSVIRARQFSDETRDLLSTHYTTVIIDFRGDIIRTIKCSNFPIVLKQADQQLIDTNRRFVERQSQVSEGRITTTTQTELNTAVAFATASLLEDGKQVTNEAVANIATNKFLSRSIGRATTISITETQNPAEESKFNQMNFLVGIGIASRFSSRKVWTSILDEVVRDTHATSDGQEKRLDENFEVTSPATGALQLLRHPGDNSLGATADNVVNCRCSGSMILE